MRERDREERGGGEGVEKYNGDPMGCITVVAQFSEGLQIKAWGKRSGFGE